MGYITRQEKQQTGKWWNWILVGKYDTVIRETDKPLSEGGATAIRDEHLAQVAEAQVTQEKIDLYEYKDLLKDAVTYIKTASPNLTQWNAWLNKLSWYDKALVQFFIATLARKLAARADVTLANYPDTEILEKLKAWIIATPAKKIARVLFGE